MENAPLTLAHTHARNALLETERSNPVAASEEHDLAAAEFATAAQSTTDSEALRILNLLQQHHKKLGHILKTRHHKSSTQDAGADLQRIGQDSTQVTAVSETTRSTSPETQSQPPRLIRPSRHPARDLSSSIASNLASARGIPNYRQKRSTPISPLITNQHADGQLLQEEDSQRHVSKQTTETATDGRRQVPTRPSWAPPLDVASSNIPDPSQKAAVDTTISDAPFQQFYSTFESLLSKLSAPLAFAGLPLTAPQPLSQPPIGQQKPKSEPSVKQRATEALQSSVDYSQLISRAALRAVRDDNRQNPSESFYVVPTSGGTTSYADIMSRAEREGARAFRDHRRSGSNLSNDDFVDASSTILSPPILPAMGRGQSELKVNGKTMEELALENNALKHLSDTLSKRLHVFEMSAQTSSAALAQSIRSLHLSPMTTPESSRGKSRPTAAFSPDQIHGATAAIETERLTSRVTELEDILRKSDARVKKRDEENAKLRDMLVKYRDKWEGLKAGAKARREKQVHGESPRKKDRTKSSGEGGSNNIRESTEPKDVETETHVPSSD